MLESQSVAARGAGPGMLVLGVDTCGPSGSVALGRIQGGKAEILGQKELAGRSYSATLVAAVGDLLGEKRLKLADLTAIVVVNGPGSFTGVRVGLSAVKGLAEPTQIQVLAVSRLAVLTAKMGARAAALDAHRHEVFLRLSEADGSARELLAGVEELADINPAPGRVAVCDDAAAELLSAAWSGTELVRSEPPTAVDAIELCISRVLKGDFADLALLDGHYLRRSDAEIFGESAKTARQEGSGIRVRRMVEADLDAVLEIAARMDDAPKWTRQTYVASLDPGNQPRRVALVAEDGSGGGLAGFAIASLVPPESELESIVTARPHQRRGVARELFARLKTELRRAEVTEIVLEVREANRAARGFYRYLGFQEEGRRAGYYAEPVEDAILMRLRLR